MPCGSQSRRRASTATTRRRRARLRRVLPVRRRPAARARRGRTAVDPARRLEARRRGRRGVGGGRRGDGLHRAPPFQALGSRALRPRGSEQDYALFVELGRAPSFAESGGPRRADDALATRAPRRPRGRARAELGRVPDGATRSRRCRRRGACARPARGGTPIARGTRSASSLRSDAMAESRGRAPTAARRSAMSRCAGEPREDRDSRPLPSPAAQWWDDISSLEAR